MAPGSLWRRAPGSISGGRHWLLQTTPTSRFVAQHRLRDSWLVLLGGLLFTGLVGSSVLVLTGREVALRRTADERSTALGELERLNRHIREEAEARFDAVLDNVGEAVVVVDQRGAIERFNTAAERIFGYRPDEVLGRPAEVLNLQADPPFAWAPQQRSNGVGAIGGRGREATAKRKSGELFPAEVAIGTMAGDHRVIAVIRDVTHRKEAERASSERESRFRDLAGSASDWFWETDQTYRLTYVSERIGAALGVKPGALIGYSFFDIGLEDDEALATAHRADLAAQHPFRDLVFHIGGRELTLRSACAMGLIVAGALAGSLDLFRQLLRRGSQAAG